MKPSTALVVMFPLVLLASLFVLVGTRGAGAGGIQDGVWWDEGVATFVRGQVASTYVDELDTARAAQAFYTAMDAYVKDLDEYCDFIPPDEYRRSQEETAGEYAGLGVKVQEVEEGLLVSGLLPTGPAAKAGLRAGDTIVAADGRRLPDLDLETIEATRLLKGEPGSRVRLTILPGPRPRDGPPPGPEREVVVTRAVVRPPTVFTRRVGPEGAFGVIRLTEFAEATEEDFDRAVATFQAAGVNGLVLDLRANGGGVLPTAVGVVDRFVWRGTIVRMEGRTRGATRIYDAKEEGTLPDTLPLVVLVNGGSASASEVVAGALQDHRRALLVGERTYGKFLVQQVLDVPGQEAAVQLTTSRYYLPSGRSYQRPRRAGNGARRPWEAAADEPGGGLLPDVVVPLGAEPRTRLGQQFLNQEALPWGEEAPYPDVPPDEVDPQLARAVDVLQGQLVLRQIRAAR